MTRSAKRLIGFASIAVLLAIAAFAFWQFSHSKSPSTAIVPIVTSVPIEPSDPSTELPTDPPFISASLIIDGSDAILMNHIPTPTTVRDLMNEMHIAYTGADAQGLGYFVQSINGRANNPASGEYWVMYVNGRMLDTNVDETRLKDGDTVEWKFERL